MRGRLAPTVSALLLALACYVSGGVLDEVFVNADGAPVSVATSGVLTRVALMPSWYALAACILAALLVWAAVGRGFQRPGAVRALAIAGVLVVPYLPFVADVVRPLQIIAGPFRIVIWCVVLGLAAWVAWQERPAASRLTVSRRSLFASIATLVIAAGLFTAHRFRDAGISPGGDQPHYLIMMQSIWRDGDLEIGNNHARGDYLEYFPLQLDPHVNTRGADGALYSIHPIGLPLLMAPVYALGGYYAVILGLLLAAVAATALVWRFLCQAMDTPGAATFAWVAVGLTTPYFLNAFAIYPEVVASLAVAIAFVLTQSKELRSARLFVVGCAVAALPWLSTKYAPMSAALLAAAIVRVWQRSPARFNDIAIVVAPYVVSLAGWFAFFYVIWGSPWPSAPYVDARQMQLEYLATGAPALLFDQEYGVLAYAPVYVLAITGLITMWRSGGELRRQAMEVGLACAALLVTVGAFQMWWGGAAAPGRPLVSALPLLMFPIAVAARSAPAGSAQQAGHCVLLAVSIAICGILIIVQNGFLQLNGRDGTSTLLEYFSPRWNLVQAAPSFGARPVLVAGVAAAAWLLIAVGAALVLRRINAPTVARAAIRAAAVFAAAVGVAVAVVPAIAGPELRPVDVRARGSSPLLEAFDPSRLAWGIRFDPFHAESAPTIVALAALEWLPDQRRDRQPVPVFGDARYELPSGRYRLHAEWNGAGSPGTIGFQTGRFGNPWREWLVTPSATSTWNTVVELPIDVNFVGFKVSPELNAIVRRLAITPEWLVSASLRTRTPLVLGAARFGDVDVFFHDQNYYQEEGGFWTRGERSVQFTVAAAGRDRPIALALTAGGIRNRVEISSRLSATRVDLAPGTGQEIELPTRGEPLTITVAAPLAFRPSDLDSQSSDRRWLGVLVRPQ